MAAIGPAVHRANRSSDKFSFGGAKALACSKGPGIDPASVPVPSFYPDHEIIRREIALHYDCISHTDRQVGWILERLEEDGLRENTIIFLFSDHGMRLPRHKQFIYEGGHKVPLMISWQGNTDIVTTRKRAFRPGQWH